MGKNYFFRSLLLVIAISLYSAPSRGIDRLLINDNTVTDEIVELLGWTGTRIAHDSVTPHKQWPKALYTLSSRILSNVIPAIQGRILPEISWRATSISPQPLPQNRFLDRWEMTRDLTPVQVKHILLLCEKILQPYRDIRPQSQNYSGTLFLGSTLISVRKRLAYMNQLIDKDKISLGPIYILTGERKLSPSIGETSQQILNRENPIIAIHDHWQAPNLLPDDEGAMIELVFAQSKHPSLQEDQIKVCYAFKNQGEHRATSESTMKKWLETSPPPGHYLAISSQPHVLYQRMILERCLKESQRLDITIDVVGPAEAQDPSSLYIKTQKNRAAVLLDTLAKIFYEIERIYKLELMKNKKSH